jgi:hypothetical protein
MCKKVQEITEVTMSNPPDMKKLQLKLQGSVGTQVCTLNPVRGRMIFLLVRLNYVARQ